MKKNVKSGQLIWWAEAGDVKQVEVAAFQRDDFPDKTRIKYPNDNVTNPWCCRDSYLFKTRKAAVRRAIKQLHERIQSNNYRIEVLKQEHKELEKDLQQLQQEAT